MEVGYKEFSLMENAMKILVAALYLSLALMFSVAVQAHEPTGDSFSLDGKITSIALDERGGVITASAEAGLYGKVFLTYNVTFNASVPDQGYFDGRGVGINDEGERAAGSRQGVFRREGHLVYFYSLDDVSDGRLNYCETVVDLRNETISMTFYPF